VVGIGVVAARLVTKTANVVLGCATTRYNGGLVNVANNWTASFTYRSTITTTGDGFALVIMADGFGGLGTLREVEGANAATMPN